MDITSLKESAQFRVAGGKCKRNDVDLPRIDHQPEGKGKGLSGCSSKRIWGELGYVRGHLKLGLECCTGKRGSVGDPVRREKSY